MARDFPKPNVEDTDPYREANALSSRFRNDLKVTIMTVPGDDDSTGDEDDDDENGAPMVNDGAPPVCSTQ